MQNHSINLGFKLAINGLDSLKIIVSTVKPANSLEVDRVLGFLVSLHRVLRSLLLFGLFESRYRTFVRA